MAQAYQKKSEISEVESPKWSTKDIGRRHDNMKNVQVQVQKQRKHGLIKHKHQIHRQVQVQVYHRKIVGRQVWHQIRYLNTQQLLQSVAKSRYRHLSGLLAN